MEGLLSVGCGLSIEDELGLGLFSPRLGVSSLWHISAIKMKFPQSERISVSQA
jgi:hypothetical protein